ncbi:MAG: tRNA 2-thiouridine(34) synthase MnmA [Planctomycetes bacterium]|nr:tRNA 2-thiouridine(34) synthase MnmA [Planctomycetota bacterium]
MSQILVAMSGGVDSSVTAALLKEQGHEIVGLFMRNGVTAGSAAQSNKQGCCSLADSQDARFVAAQLGARFYVLNFAEDFQRVIDYFVDEYKRGRTPNPCAVCNTDLKFGKLLDYAKAVGAEKVATGHYSQVEYRDGRWRLLRGVDRSKDQSYYLFGLTQEQLSRALFPLGGMTKKEAREHAARLDLKTRDKPESMEICFVPEGDYRAVVAQHSPDVLVRGDIVSTSGEKLGEHDGIAGFTIGQRRGIGIAAPKALYVVKLEPQSNTVVVGDVEDLEIERIRVANLNWIAFESLPENHELRAIVKVRYRHDGEPATIIGGKDSVEVVFDEPIRAATPGQCAVFYSPDSDEVLGGGWIV